MRIEFRQAKRSNRVVGRLGVIMCLLVMAGIAPYAHAFFVFGGAKTGEDEISFIRWSRLGMDGNHDYVISGPEDGIEMTFEKGPLGFTDEEEEEIRAAFKVWEDVPTAYPLFRFTNPIYDILEVSAGYGLGGVLAVDGFNLLAMEMAGDTMVVPLGPGVLGIAQIDFAIDDGYWETPDGILFPLTGGQIYECDIVFNAAEFRPFEPGGEPNAELFDVAVHEIGHLLGIAHSPVNNLVLQDLRLVESPVLAMRNPTTQLLEHVGVTPTMFPWYSEIDLGTSERRPIGGDLAPDDIAAVSFLYPQGSQDRFFNIKHEVRSKSHPNMPSTPILGSHVIAWLDVEDGSGSPRSGVPLISTMTGFYQHSSKEHMRGWFDLKGLPKEVETLAGGPYPASYTITSQPFDPNKDLSIYPADVWDVVHTFGIAATPWGVAYDQVFASEVFHESPEPVYGAINRDTGTALFYDKARRNVVSVDSAKTLATILPGNTPMFGDRNDVCPLNLASTGLGSSKVNDSLRGLRDTVLLQTAVGAALVDAYYQAAPVMASFLVEHGRVLGAARMVMAVGEWAILHVSGLALALLAACLVVLVLRRRLKAVRTVSLLLAAAICLWTQPSQAIVRLMSMDEMLGLDEAKMSEVGVFVVESVESKFIETTRQVRIFTEITLRKTKHVQGDLNIDSTVSLTIPGGQVGVRVSYVPVMPTFRVGEEALFYLRSIPDYGYALVGALNGKKPITTNSVTGKKYVADFVPVTYGKSADGSITKREPVLLEDYISNIQQIVKEHKGR